MELFLWKTQDEIKEISEEKIKHELADIFIYLSYIAEKIDIDLEKAILDKIKLNAEKYPVSKSYGSNKKYNQL